MLASDARASASGILGNVTFLGKPQAARCAVPLLSPVFLQTSAYVPFNELPLWAREYAARLRELRGTRSLRSRARCEKDKRHSPCGSVAAGVRAGRSVLAIRRPYGNSDVIRYVPISLKSPSHNRIHEPFLTAHITFGATLTQGR